MMSRIRNLIVVFYLCMISVTTIYAQDSKRFQAIETEKIAFITRELNLTRSEAQQFFPVYNEYSKEIWSIKKAKNNNSRVGGNNFRNESRDVIAFDAKEVEVKKNYRDKFAKIIGGARSSQFFEVEGEFREYLIKSLKNRKGNN